MNLVIQNYYQNKYKNFDLDIHDISELDTFEILSTLLKNIRINFAVDSSIIIDLIHSKIVKEREIYIARQLEFSYYIAEIKNIDKIIDDIELSKRDDYTNDHYLALDYQIKEELFYNLEIVSDYILSNLVYILSSVGLH